MVELSIVEGLPTTPMLMQSMGQAVTHRHDEATRAWGMCYELVLLRLWWYILHRCDTRHHHGYMNLLTRMSRQENCTARPIVQQVQTWICISLSLYIYIYISVSLYIYVYNIYIYIYIYICYVWL